MLRKVTCLLLALPLVVWAYSAVHAQVPCVLLGASSGTANQNGSPNGQLALLNPATGAFTHICTLGFGLGAMAQNPVNGLLYAVDAPGFQPPSGTTRRLILLDPNNCSETTIGTNFGTGFRFGIADLAFRSDGTLFAWSENSDDLITINITTGLPTIVANAGISTFGSGLEFDPGGTLWLAGNGGGGVLRTVNPATGVTTVGPTLTGSPAPGFPISAMSFGNGQMYAVNKTRFPSSTLPSQDNLIIINLTTGAITNLGQSVNKLDAIAWYCAPAAPTFGTWQTLILTIVLVSAAYWQLRRTRHITV